MEVKINKLNIWSVLNFTFTKKYKGVTFEYAYQFNLNDKRRYFFKMLDITAKGTSKVYKSPGANYETVISAYDDTATGHKTVRNYTSKLLSNSYRKLTNLRKKHIKPEWRRIKKFKDITIPARIALAVDSIERAIAKV
jgi:hypothetical protein